MLFTRYWLNIPEKVESVHPKQKKQKELLSYTRSSCSYAIALSMTSFEEVVFFCHQGRQSDWSMLPSRVPKHPSIPVLPYSIADHAD
jgi:hypothetical protein